MKTPKPPESIAVIPQPKETGGPAFPYGVRVDRVDTYLGKKEKGYEENEPGMTLRDWFAGKALSGVVVNWPRLSPHDLAHSAYAVADAMLEARKK